MEKKTSGWHWEHAIPPDIEAEEQNLIPVSYTSWKIKN